MDYIIAIETYRFCGGVPNRHELNRVRAMTNIGQCRCSRARTPFEWFRDASDNWGANAKDDVGGVVHSSARNQIRFERAASKCEEYVTAVRKCGQRECVRT